MDGDPDDFHRELVYTNAGHNPPLLGRAEGSFEYLKMRSGLVLAGMEGIIYREAQLKLESRDTLYLYTDGVTEATDIYEKMYGEEKLQTYLNSHQGEELESILHGIKAELDLFAKGAPQFDDITMLILRRGNSNFLDDGINTIINISQRNTGRPGPPR